MRNVATLATSPQKDREEQKEEERITQTILGS